jgi:flavorubredoxin
MGASLLIAYATRYGATGEVAEVIGARLAELGHSVDVREVAQVGSLDGYSAVVLGTPARGGTPVSGFTSCSACARARGGVRFGAGFKGGRFGAGARSA